MAATAAVGGGEDVGGGGDESRPNLSVAVEKSGRGRGCVWWWW